jgi:uncharacterized repeat protein (TIGR01451 family)
MKTRRTGLAVSAAAFALCITGSALAMHDDGLFELDGNVANSPSVLGDDWSNIYAGGNGAFATSFVTDGVLGNEQSFFTGGGSKDISPIVAWRYGTTSDVVPDKDDLEHAFAAAYVNPADGHTIFYFGADRFDAGDGSAELGFWFFRDHVALGPLTAGQTTGGFTGEHRVGDILIHIDFLNGGALESVSVLRWVGGGKPLEVVVERQAADCANLAPGVDDLCAMVNHQGGETPPWPYTDKNHYPANTPYAANALFEGGIDMTVYLGPEIGCFSSFLAETRSAGPSESSQLKDFVLGEFPVCSIDVTKSARDLSKVGDAAVQYAITVHNTGRARLYKQSINDTLLGNLTSSCGPSLAADDGAAGGPDECTFNYPYTVKAGDPDPVLNKVTVVYDERADLTGIELTDEYTETVNLFQPSIDVTKSANKSIVMEGQQVDYTIVLKNTSSSDTPALNCTLTDTVLGVSKTVNGLVAGATDETVKAMTWTSVATKPACSANVDGSYSCTNTASASCTPAGFPNKLADSAQAVVKVQPLGTAFTLSKSGDTYSKVGDTVQYTAAIRNLSTLISLQVLKIDDSLAGNLLSKCPGTLSPNDGNAGGTDECTFTYEYVVPKGAPDPLLNTITARLGADTANYEDKEASWSVDLVAPAVSIAKTCTEEGAVQPGDYVSFEVDVTNTGTADLVVDVDDTLSGWLVKDLPLPVKDSCSYGEATNDNLDGCYRIEVSYQASTTDVHNAATVYASLAAKYGLPNEFTAEDDATCHVSTGGGATRTLGFWKTHGSDGTLFPTPVEYGYTCYIARLAGATGSGFIDLGWKKLYTCEQVFGMFWATPGKCTTKADQSRLNPSWQFLAAILNKQAFGTAIPESCKGQYAGKTDAELFALMRTALSSASEKDYRKLAGVFACYNESGTYESIVDTQPVPHADPNGTRAVASNITGCSK